MTEHSEDRALVERMLAGDAAAFESFAGRYPRALYRFAHAHLDGDRELTRELVQTALCKALAKLDGYRGEASLLTWLCACCRNEVLMYRRGRSTAPAAVELEDDLVPAAGFRLEPARDPEVAVLRRETATRVHMTLDLLPEHYARALEWKYVDRLPVRDIAARLELGPKAAESVLTRARKAFRDGWESLRGGGLGVPGRTRERVLKDGTAR